MRSLDAVVTIRVNRGSKGAHKLGSGFAIDSEGYLVTALHVLDGATSVRVMTADGRKFEEIVVQALDVEHDLVLFQLAADDLPFIPVAQSVEPAVGDQVTVIGSPYGLERTITEGIVSAWREPPDPEDEEPLLVSGMPQARVIQMTAGIGPGSSGGPVLGKDGSLVGIAVAGIAYGLAGMDFAIPANALEPLLEVRSGLDLDSFRSRSEDLRQAHAEPDLMDARLALELGEEESGRRYLDRALTLYPEYVDALMLKSEIEAREGRLPAARDILQHASELKASSAEVWSRLGHVYIELGNRSDVRQAFECFERALDLEPDHAAAAFGLGRLEFQEGRYRSAIRLLQIAVALDPAHLEAGTKLGEAQLFAGQPETAIETLEAVLDGDPNWALAHQVLARAYIKVGEEGRAQEHIGEFLRLSRDDPELEKVRRRTIKFLRLNPHLVPFRMQGEIAESQ